jgi:hypothetical protein
VYFDGTAFTKNGGIIYGSDAGVLDKNTAGTDGHAVYVYVDGGSGDKKRNITAGSTVGLDSTTPFNWE